MTTTQELVRLTQQQADVHRRLSAAEAKATRARHEAARLRERALRSSSEGTRRMTLRQAERKEEEAVKAQRDVADLVSRKARIDQDIARKSETVARIQAAEDRKKEADARKRREDELRHHRRVTQEMERQSYISRFDYPSTVIHTGPMTFNNIHVDRSVIGAINTGTIESLDIQLSDVRNAGEDDLAKSVAAFAEAILNAPDVADATKEDLLEQLTFVSEQSQVDAQQRRKGLLRGVIRDIGGTAGTVNSLAQAWRTLEPLFDRLLG